ncbi:MAG: MFS transporter [Opitutales bacterium]|nr:MFS transporter [Opitutales bacterium]
MKENSIKLTEKVGYALGDTASNFFFQTFNLFLLYYYTDIFGLPAVWVGSMMLAARLWDAVSDPLMGVIADRTKTRWGRYRPYLLWMSIPYGIVGFLVFANPDLDTMAQKKIYAAVTYLMMMTAYTAINIPYSALMGVMSRSSDERTTLSTFRFVGAFSGALVISACALPLKNYLGGVTEDLQGAALVQAEATGFRLTMLLFAIASIIFFVITFATTRERIDPPKSENASIFRDFKILLQNRPWVVMWIAAILTLTNTAVRNGAIIYYFKYFVGSETQATYFYTTGGIAMVLGVASTKLFTARWSKKNLMIVLSTLNAICILVFFFIPKEQVWLMHIVNAVGTFVVGPTPALVWALYSDTADYAEWKFKRRATALTFSSAMFAQKLGLALGAGMAGWILSYLGFVANQAQTDEAILGIRLIFSVIPAVFAFANAGVMLLYPLNEAKVAEIEADLQARTAE